MIEYIRGAFTDLKPTYIIVEAGGVGYVLQISLHSYGKLLGNESGKVYAHQVIREDEHLLYGFSAPEERDIFRALISVNGVGPAIARMMLNSHSPEAIRDAIVSGNLPLLKSVKGIGPKSAQRLIVELQDKLGKLTPETAAAAAMVKTAVLEEAIAAMTLLGIQRAQAEKALTRVSSEHTGEPLTIEELLKRALKIV